MAGLPKDHFSQINRFTKRWHQKLYPAIDPSRPELSLAGKVAVITGASRGIGALGIAPAIVKAGARAVVLVATDEAKLREVDAGLKKLNQAVETLASTADITDAAAVRGLFDTIKARWGHADVLVNNAGVSFGGEIHEQDPESWWKNMVVNVRAPFLLTQAFLAALPDPKSTPATVINASSTIAYQVIPGSSGYSTSKAAMLMLTAHIAASYPNVTAISLGPGLVDTDALMDFFKPFDLNSPDVVGGTVVWLAHDPERSRFLSGRYVGAEWDVEDLLARKEEIVEKGLLKVDLVGTMGKEQFGE